MALRRTRISILLLLAVSGLGFLANAAAAAAGSCGTRGVYGHSGHHRGHGIFRGAIHHGLRSYGVRTTAGLYGHYRNYAATSGYRSYGGFTYRTFPTHRFYPSRSRAYSYPVSYAPVADASVYATPGSVYDPVFQHGVAAQPVDDGYYGDYPVSGTQQPQPIYIIVQPASAGSQEPVQAPQPAAAEPAPPTYQPLAVSGGEAGQVFLSVHPVNAAVYLDEDLLGTGESLAAGQEPLVLDSGVHVLEVVHPQFQTQRLVFGMPSAGRLLIEFDLEGDRRGRKARVRSLDPSP